MRKQIFITDTYLPNTTVLQNKILKCPIVTIESSESETCRNVSKSA